MTEKMPEKTLVIGSTEPDMDRTMPLDQASTQLWKTPEFRTHPEKVKRLQRMLDSTQLSMLRDMEEAKQINIHKLLHQLHEPDSTEVFANGDRCFNELPNVNAIFDIKEKIAEGGQGAVYMAADKKLRRYVAMKNLHPHLAEQNTFRNTFLAEARVTAQLDHPAIIPVHGLFEDQAHNLYLAMKLVKGVTLKSFLDKTNALYELMQKRQIRTNEHTALRDRIDIFLRVCEAIAYAHYKRVIHRDLKPANIMLGAFHETYVMDWGIAECQANPVKPEDRMKLAGTIRYIAPEILAHQPYDSRSDIYSLGAILFELVFLKPLYDAPGATELRGKVCRHELESFTHRFACPVDRELKEIIEKALAHLPADRYQTVKGLQEDLRNYLHGEAVSVSPDSVFSKRLFGKFCG